MVDRQNGSGSILPVRRSVTIGTIIKLDDDGVGIGDGVRMCKQAFRPLKVLSLVALGYLMPLATAQLVDDNREYEI